MKILYLAACLLFPLSGEIVDRLAIIVGQQTITELQLDEEIRVTALLNNKPIVRDAETRRAAADRLVEQLLIRHEMEQSHYPLPGAQEVDQYVAQIRQQTGPPAAFAQALAAYQLSENTLRQHLELQLVALRFVEYRFRPDATVSDEEIETAYRRKIADWKTQHTGNPPALESSREAIRTELTAQRTDAALNAWLAESRRQMNIVYLDRSLQ